MVNLDPAVLEVPFEPNIDIRDTVNYKEVMKQYGLGPNGGILTSLNLFTTKFDQVLDVLEGRAASLEYVLLDTPGQIEVFTWSASGAIITEALASHYPTVVVYVIDTPRCSRPATFMSNMLYACSILYKTRLPMVLVFNKTDVEPADRMVDWMQDVLLFQEEALAEDESYMASLVQSMSLVLDEFYKTLRVAAVSAFTGEGMDDFFAKVAEAVQEYETEYRVELERRRAERQERTSQERAHHLERLMRDLRVDGGADDANAAAAGDGHGDDDEGKEEEGEEANDQTDSHQS